MCQSKLILGERICLLHDDDLSQTIIPHEQTDTPHHGVWYIDLALNLGIRPFPEDSLWKWTIATPPPHPTAEIWQMDRISLCNRERRYVDLHRICDDPTAVIFFKAWESLGPDYTAKVEYRKTRKILEFNCKFAIVVIDKGMVSWFRASLGMFCFLTTLDWLADWHC